MLILTILNRSARIFFKKLYCLSIGKEERIMKENKNLLLIISVALFSAMLLFPVAKVYAWGSSDSRWDDGYSGGSSDHSDSSWHDDTDGGWGGSLTEDDCRNCHEDLDRFPQLVDTNPDKHHILVGLQIPSWSIAPYGIPGENYECLSCHSVEQTEDMLFEISVIRDCLQCHPIQTVTGSPRSENVHHMTETYRQRRCNDCHSILGW
jgi:hypothetical protein